MFSTYCERKFEVEPVQVIYSDGSSCDYPDISPFQMEVSLSYIADINGVPLEENEVSQYLLFYFVLFLRDSLKVISPYITIDHIYP